MTDNSKENLLKIITNKQNGTPGSETLDINKISTNLDITSGYTFEYNNKIINIHNYYIYVYNEDETLLYSQAVQINNENVGGNWTMDSEGNLYAVIYRGTPGKYYLTYWNNPTIKVNGRYEFKVKRSYDIDSVIDEATLLPGSTFQFTGGMFAGFSKSPFDSRFVIFVTAFAGNIMDMYNFTAIVYQVNVGSTNTYSFIHTTTGSDNMEMLDYYVEWTNNNCNFTCAVRGQDQLLPDLPTTRKLYQYTGQINSSTISATSWTLSNNVNIGYKYIDSTHSYGVLQSATNNILNTELYYINGTWNNRTLVKKLTTTPAKYPYRTPTGSFTESYVDDWFYIFVTKNNEVFFIEYKLKETGEYYEDIKYGTKFLHIKNGSILYTYELDDTYYTILAGGIYMKLDYNLYTGYLKKYAQDFTNTKYKIVFVYNQDSYNGTPYISNTSLMGSGGIIKKNNVPIFARDLYNAEQINNQITSIVQIPNYYLNNETEITQELISQTNSVISDTAIEIDKNQYEQVFLTWLEQYKIYDNNNGSTYMQQPTFKLAENIFNGFTDNYKITNYRINYKDETTEDKSIPGIQITDNIATISFGIYPTKLIDNIQFYDSSYSIPFITLDLSNLEINKLYVITQKIKVE